MQVKVASNSKYSQMLKSQSSYKWPTIASVSPRHVGIISKSLSQILRKKTSWNKRPEKTGPISPHWSTVSPWVQLLQILQSWLHQPQSRNIFLKIMILWKYMDPFSYCYFLNSTEKSRLNNIYNILSAFLKSLSWAGIYKQYRPPIIRSQTKTQFHQIFRKVKEGI